MPALSAMPTTRQPSRQKNAARPTDRTSYTHASSYEAEHLSFRFPARPGTFPRAGSIPRIHGLG